MIYNPIIRGFNPDPSICFDGKRYYIVTSTFEYYPSCAIYTSTDLSSWTFHSYAIRNQKLLDLSGCENSKGTYAATIRYNKGRWYVVTTTKKTNDNFIVWTDDIDSRKWNGPFIVRNGGIDPSLYFEDDWCYYCSNGVVDGVRGILGARINPDTGEFLEREKLLTEGITQHATEAPHIFKRGDWYYLIVAEGGTGTGHHENVLRSKNIDGPYEAGPNNPILSHIKRKGHPIQCVGHADLIDIGSDNWLAVFLAVRVPERSVLYNLGRETFMAEVSWCDGWPMIANGGFVDFEMPSDLVKMENEYKLTEIDYQKPLEEQNIEMLRVWDDSIYSQDLENGEIEIHGKEAITTPYSNPSMILLRQEEFEEEFSTTLHLGHYYSSSAGIAVWLSNHYNMIIRIKNEDGILRYEVERSVHDLRCTVASGDIGIKPFVRLAIKADRKCYRAYVDDKEVASAVLANFSSNNTMDSCFTGTMFALFAENGDATFLKQGEIIMSEVTLEELIDCVTSSSDDQHYYYDKETDVTVLISDGEIFAPNEVEDMEVEEIEENGERFIRIPSHSNWDYNEYDILKDFINSLSDRKAISILSNAISGRGAFRRFKDRCIDLGLIEDWYAFHENAIKEIVLEWANEHELIFPDRPRFKEDN